MQLCYGYENGSLVAYRAGHPSCQEFLANPESVEAFWEALLGLLEAYLWGILGVVAAVLIMWLGCSVASWQAKVKKALKAAKEGLQRAEMKANLASASAASAHAAASSANAAAAEAAYAHTRLLEARPNVLPVFVTVGEAGVTTPTQQAPPNYWEATTPEYQSEEDWDAEEGEAEDWRPESQLNYDSWAMPASAQADWGSEETVHQADDGYAPSPSQPDWYERRA